MDNVTHSLAGLLIAEATNQLHERRTGTAWTPGFRTLAASASLLAANLPDADLFYAGTGGGLGYLLHHRGHTHTVAAVLVLAPLLWAAIAGVWRWRARELWSANDMRWLLGLLLVSMMSHVALDFTNSYGVHPFWPIDNRWRYGDAVFIVEPWLWVASVPTLVLASQRGVARVLLSVVLLGGLLLAARVSLVTLAAWVALASGAAVSIALAAALRHRASTRAVVAVSSWIAATLVFATGARMARASVVDAVRATSPRTELLEVVVSPLAANAVCVSAIAVERSGTTYRVSTARASALPFVTPASRCPDNGRSGDMPAPTRRSSNAVAWTAEWSAPVAELTSLVRESCVAAAALRFIRVPIWRALNDSTVLLGDVRYGGTAAGGFTAVAIPRRSATCPRGVPPWIPPRADLLGA